MNYLKRNIKNFLDERAAKKKVKLSRSKTGTFFMSLFLLSVSVFMILPMFYAFVQSFKPIGEIFAYPPKFFVKNPTFDNYLQVFKLSGNLWVPFSRYLLNSIFVSAVGTIGYILIATLAAYFLAKSGLKSAKYLSNVIVLAMMFSGSVTAVPQYLIISKLYLVDTWGAIILPAFAATMGVFLMKQFIISSIPDALLEAARIDGAGEYKIYHLIVLPNVKPAWLTLMIFTFQSLWNGNGGDYIYSEDMKLLPTVLANIASGGIARTGAAAAVSVIVMLPPILIFIYSQSSVMETMTHSGLK